MTLDVDFFVSAIHYSNKNNSKQYVDRFRVHNNYIDSLSTPSRWRRDVIIMRIESGKKFYSVSKHKDGSFTKGEMINVVNVDGEKFLQTNVCSKCEDIIEDVHIV